MYVLGKEFFEKTENLWFSLTKIHPKKEQEKERKEKRKKEKKKNKQAVYIYSQ